AITKAPAPMIGGISAPPVDAAASTPAENWAEKPSRFIIGMVITPVDTVLATAEPETEPISPEPITATSPDPPIKRPARQRDRLTIKSPAPDLSRKDPNRINMNTKVAEILAVLPNMPSSL